MPPLPSFRTVLVVCLLAIQIPLWLSPGGWLEVWKKEAQVESLVKQVEDKELIIAELEAELRDLRSGHMAAEERARFELGLLKSGERFVQY
ncbi:MAG: cell division protein FtsB [Pseudomonadota bacterium]|jgi:cell division protein FtsB